MSACLYIMLICWWENKIGRTKFSKLHFVQKRNSLPFKQQPLHFKLKFPKFHNVILFWTSSPILKTWRKTSAFLQFLDQSASTPAYMFGKWVQVGIDLCITHLFKVSVKVSSILLVFACLLYCHSIWKSSPPVASK